jgi:hypothetical protein
MPKPRKRASPARDRARALKRATAEAYRIWSLIVRRGRRCVAEGQYVRCGGALQGCHIFGKKAYPAVRWISANGLCCCAGHHRWFHQHPVEWEDLARREMDGRILPDELDYDSLRVHATETSKETPFAAVDRLARLASGLHIDIDKRVKRA